MAETVLKITNLTKNYSGRIALSGAQFSINEGEIVGFIGPNGSGKTTCIKSIFGLIRYDEGEIEVMGKSVNDRKEALKYVNGIVENPEFYKYLSGKENLVQIANMYEHPADEHKIDELLKLVDLYDRKDDKVGKYSLGMKQRLGIAQALINDPKLLILDEPTNGLDPEGIKMLRDIMKKVASMGTAVFVSSHQLAELENVCDRYIIVSKGKILANLTLDEIHSIGAKHDIFTIETLAEKVEEAKNILSSSGYEVQNDGKKIRVYLSDGQTKNDVLRVLIDSNVPVNSMNDVRRSLEDTYMKILSGEIVMGGRNNG